MPRGVDVMTRSMVSESVWGEQVIDAVERLAESGNTFTVDDVRARVDEPAPSDLSWCSIWSWKPCKAVATWTGEFRESNRKEAKRHTLRVMVGLQNVQEVTI